MTMRNAFVAAVGLAALAAAGVGCTRLVAPARTGATARSSVDSARAGTPTPLSVNTLAADPSAHRGRVSVVGVVAKVTAGRGFALIDKKEFAACGLTCLSEPETKMIPIRWAGASPKVGEEVRVDGSIASQSKGLRFTAKRVAKR